MRLFFISTKSPIFAPAPILAPGLRRAYGPTSAFLATNAPSRVLEITFAPRSITDEHISQRAPISAPARMTLLPFIAQNAPILAPGSMTTNASISVVAGSSSRTPAFMW